MKGIKIFLSIVTLLLLIAIGCAVYVWYTFQSFEKPASPVSEITPKVVTPQNAEVAPPSLNIESTPEPITIEKSDLSESQAKTLETLGFTQESYTITPLMIVCAEEAVGETRLAEITGGAAPTPLESLRLLPCFKN